MAPDTIHSVSVFDDNLLVNILSKAEYGPIYFQYAKGHKHG